jgi:hypothetical protein
MAEKLKDHPTLPVIEEAIMLIRDSLMILPSEDHFALVFFQIYNQP